MKPYYSHAGITIYHADCREVLPTISDVDTIITDPPYGMNYTPLRGSDGSKKWGDRVSRKIAGDDAAFDPSHILFARVMVLWGAQWYSGSLPPSGGWLVWDKTPNGRKDGFYASDCDLAWTNTRSSIRKFEMQWGGEARGNEAFFHPTQKPVALMSFCIEMASPQGLIVDPYCGSGPTLAAAKLRGLSAIGIEVEERYCEIAAKRLSQEVFLFTEGEES